MRPAAEREELRPLAWTDLTSRLSAARDLRASLAGGEAAGQASFDALSARWIAAHPADEAAVNREDSANRKGPSDTWDGREGDARPAGGVARDQ